MNATDIELSQLSLNDLGHEIMNSHQSAQVEELSTLCSAVILKFDGKDCHYCDEIELEYYRAQHNFTTNPSCHHWNCLIAMMVAWQGIQPRLLEIGRRGKR